MEENKPFDEQATQEEIIPEEVKPSPAKPIGWLMLITLILFMATALLTELLFTHTNEFVFQIAGAIFTTIGAILVPSLVHIFVKRQKNDSYNLNKLPENQILPCILFGIGLCFAALILANIITATYYTFGVDLSKTDTPLPDMRNLFQFIIITLCVAVAPAVCEEMLCRSAVLYTFRPLGMYKAALWSGLFFALLHLNLTMLPMYAALGFIFGLIAYKTRSVFATMIVHFVYNFSIISLQMIPFEDDGAAEAFSLASGELWIILVVFAVIAAAFLVPAVLIFNKNCRKNDESEAQKLGLSRQQYLDSYNHPTEKHAPFGMAGVVITFVLLVLFTLLIGIAQISDCVIK